MVSNEHKMIFIKNSTNLYHTGLQYEVYGRIKPTDNSDTKRELSYVKDETIEEKDCIFVKETTYYKTEDDTIVSDSDLDEDIRAYWIEKSTGFVLGGAMIKPKQKDAIPEIWIKSITFNEVVDSDFDLPTDYEIISN